MRTVSTRLNGLLISPLIYSKWDAQCQLRRGREYRAKNVYSPHISAGNKRAGTFYAATSHGILAPNAVRLTDERAYNTLSTRSTLQLVAVAMLATATTAAVRADVTQTVNASTCATVKPAGPRTGANGLKFFNVEGSSNGANASYGVLRFDAAPLKAAFDTQYGIGGYTLSGVALSLIESNAAFTKPGDISFAYSPDNAMDISAANTSLQYDAANVLHSHQFAQTFITGASFNTTGNVNNGQVDLYDLKAADAGGDALVNAILGGQMITLIVNDEDEAVAATWTGSTNAKPPFLTVSAVQAVPEPGSIALLLGAAPALLAFRRRRS